MLFLEYHANVSVAFGVVSPPAPARPTVHHGPSRSIALPNTATHACGQVVVGRVVVKGNLGPVIVLANHVSHLLLW